jgi:flagellar biosynthesis/type III secretory pathway protein FliH
MDDFDELPRQWDAEGYAQGLADGAARGREEGFEMAREPAHALGTELGSIAGQACARLHSSEGDSTKLKKLLSMILDVRLSNEEDLTRDSAVARIRAMAVSLGLRVESNTDSKALLEF